MYPPDRIYPLRTLNGIEQAAKHGMKSGQIINGVKGVSSLSSHMLVVKGVPVDYMHCVLEGVTSWLLKAWADSKYS